MNPTKSPLPRTFASQSRSRTLLVLGTFLACASLFHAPSANAQSAATIESAQSGEYTDTLTWVGNVVPIIGGALGTAQVDINRDTTVTVTSGTAGTNDRLRIGINTGTSGTFTIQGGTFIAAGNEGASTAIGVTAGDTGTLNVTSGLGSFNSQSIIIGANGTNRTGIVNVSGGTLDQDGGDFLVGDRGAGSLTVTGGLVDVAKAADAARNFEVGQVAGSVGSVNISAGVVQVGSATTAATGASVNIGGDNTAGAAGGLGGEGYMVVTGGTFIQNPTLVGSDTVGAADNRTFRVGADNGAYGQLDINTAGVVAASNDFLLGAPAGSTGVLNMGAGGVLNVDGDVIVGNTFSGGAAGSALGILNFSGGDINVGQDGFNTGMNNTGANLFIGNAGTGLANITAGNLDIARQILVGQGNANGEGLGSVNQTGGLVNTNAAQAVIIGNSGYGEWTISGGTLTASTGGDIILGNRSNTNNSAGTGVLTISGADTVVGGLVNNGGANFQIANSFDNNNPSDASEGTMNLNGGLATGGNMLLANRGLGFYNQTGGTLDLLTSFVVGDSGSNTLASPTIVAGSGFANITGGVVDVDDAFILGEGNVGATAGIQYQDSRDALGSLNVGGTALFLTNTASADGANNESNTEIGFNGTGFLTVSGGTFLSNHAGAIGTNGADNNAGGTPGEGNDGADVRLGVTNALNDDAASRTAGTRVANTADSAPFGQIEVSSGKFIAARDISAGLGSFATGNVIVSGGHLQVDGDIRLADGNDTKSVSSISGGYVETGFAIRDSGGSAQNNNDGGNINVADGARSSAILNISGGSTQVAQDMIVGVGADSAGTVNLSGGIVKVGEEGSTTNANPRSLNNGVWVRNGNNEVIIGNNASAIGEFNVTGGTLQALDPNNGNSTARDNGLANVIVGNSGTGILTVSGTGRIDSQGSMTVGNGLTATGMVTQTGGFLNFAEAVTNDMGETISLGDHLQIGNNGSGFFNITGGTIEIESTFNGQAGTDDNSNRLLRLGLRADGYGSMNIGGDAYVHANEARIGEGSFRNTNDAGRTKRAEGILTISGGSAVFDGSGGNPAVGNGTAIIIGHEDDSTGTLNVTGGHLVTNGDIVMANLGAISSFGAADTAIFGPPEGFYNQTGGTVDVGNGSGGNDDFIVGNRGEGTVNVTGGVLNIDRNLTLGNLSDTVGTDNNGAGFGSGVATIAGTAQVNVGGNVILGNSFNTGAMQGTTGTLNIAGDAAVSITGNVNVGNAGAGALNVTGTTSPTVSIGGNLNIATSPTSSGRVTLSGSNSVSVGGNVVIGSATNADASLTQTGGVLIVDGALVTSFVEDMSGTASGYAFSGGTLTRSTNDTLVITGDLVITDTATVIVTGGTLQAPTDPADPYSGFPGATLGGIDLSISEGFAAVDVDASGNFQGAGVFDFDNANIIPMANGTTLQSGILWFASLGDATGSSGGDAVDSLTSTFLDEIALINIANLEPGATRLTETQFETMVGPGMMFDSAADGISYYALVNGDGIVGFPDPRTGSNLGLAWVVAVPEPGSALLVLLGSALFIRRRRARG